MPGKVANSTRTVPAALPWLRPHPVHPPGVWIPLADSPSWQQRERGMEIYFHLAATGFYVESAPHPPYLRISSSKLPALLLKGRSPLSG